MINTVVGAWKLITGYNHLGQVSSNTLYGLNMERVNGKDGYCEGRIKYSDAGWITEFSYWDANGERAMSFSNNSSYSIMEYHPSGLQTKVAHYDDHGQPIDCFQGYHSMESFYDSHLNIYKRLCRDAHGSLTLYRGWNSCAVEDAYDKDGICVYESFIEDEDGHFSMRIIAIDTLDYPRLVYQNSWGDIAFSDGQNVVEYTVDDEDSFKKYIESKVREYKNSYAKREGIDYSFD